MRAVHLVTFGCADIRVQDINDAGLMAVQSVDAPDAGDMSSYAFDGTTWTELIPPGSLHDCCRDINVMSVNNQGQFAGYYLSVDGREHGFVATPSLNLVQR